MGSWQATKPEGSEMAKQKVGLTLFWIGAVYAVVWGLLASLSVASALRTSTIAELAGTTWDINGIWQTVWGFSVPLGVLVAGIGVLLYGGAKGSTTWIYGVGVFLAVFLGILFTSRGHTPSFFGIGGALILFSLLGVIWHWAKERKGLEGVAGRVADLRMAAYALFGISAWFICGGLGMPFMRAFQGEPPLTPTHIMIPFASGWICLFLSHHFGSRERVERVGTGE
jgi:hypothetical protein